MFSDVVYKWLDVALDNGICEKDFWDFTIAELERAIKSKQRVKRMEAKEKASYDYILANLIGKSVARIYNSQNKFPDIVDVYPELFEKELIEEARQKKRDEASIIRFKQFADSFNKRFKKEEAK